MTVKANLHQTCANNYDSLKVPICHDKVVLNQLKKQEESEFHGDNNSFVYGSDYAKTRASDHNSYAEKKNTSYGSASVYSFSETEKAVNGQPASCCLVGSPCGEVEDNHPRRSNRSSDESSQEILCCSNKSDFSEISSLLDSCAGASLAKVGTGINERQQTAELKSSTVVKEVNTEETTIGSRPAACSDGSDSTEYEVKVCDICGDIGREELLAVCSNCNDGAEHIYCMRVNMDNVPKGDWMCEECMFSKETEKQREDELEGGVRIFKKTYSVESETKDLEVEESKAHSVSSMPLYSSKRPVGSSQAVRKRPFGTVSPNTSSSSSKTSMHQSGGHSSSTTMKTVRIPVESSSKSPKLSSQSQVSKGFLFKSKSFSALSLKEDVQQLKEGSFHSEGFAKETAASESKGSSPNEGKKRVVNVRQHVEYSTEVVLATTMKHSNGNVQSDEWPCLRDSSMFDSEVHMPSWISAVPQLDYIWHGKFEIQRSGGLPFTCDGMQAHLSIYASHKVLEVVQKLPRKLLLEEAPRLSMWPTQFMKCHATEDNIALYFFAKDLDSNEKSYKNLLDRMIKNDFSLKGNFGGVELSIFSSNILPGKSQRWNNLLFLWGVFRVKRLHCSRQIPALFASENSLPPGKSSQNLSASLASFNTQQTLNSNSSLVSKAVTSGRVVEVCETKASSWEQKPPDFQTSCSQQVGRVDSSQNFLQREESESKRKHEIDLNYSLQENQEHFADCTSVDGRHDCKRLKTSLSGLNMVNNSIKDINERCSIAIDGKGPSISGELRCNGAYDISIVSPQLDSVANKYRWKSLQRQVLPNDSGNGRDSSVSSLELKLGVESSSSDEGDMPPFFMSGKDLGDKNSERETSDSNPSLALSLALPYPKVGGRVLKPDSEMKLPKCQEVNTTLSLFGSSSDYWDRIMVFDVNK
ncbi:uncharacterized protein LOC111276330 isoform X3 [Durio zibethinus]|uniref:Uncharacterized protein LOC111276330 isoform X3 n=1 Tax=Durio zibethinus TaxID=66656 RepID=A0A6P5WQ58_DURZI|nr:uncharacterized protein LOC111276330 isoform X3 [Durio zibethinus]